jgi:hypothetical protein
MGLAPDEVSTRKEPNTATPSIETARGWVGRVMVDRDSNKIGEVVDIYLDMGCVVPAASSGPLRRSCPCTWTP